VYELAAGSVTVIVPALLNKTRVCWGNIVTGDVVTVIGAPFEMLPYVTKLF
jgi:hypothetical protein